MVVLLVYRNLCAFLYDLQHRGTHCATPNIYIQQPHSQFPHTQVRNLRGVSDAQLEECMTMLAQVVEENLGMAMMYNLVTAAQDWLREKVWLWVSTLYTLSTLYTSTQMQCG